MKLKKNIQVIIFALFAVGFAAVLAACSTKKNTWISRAYHNVNAEFNVKFNGNEAYKAGVKKADAYLPQDYGKLPPVFAYRYNEIPGKVSGDMDRVIEKCEKLVLKHSITAKPKKTKTSMTKKQREFYNQNEFCAVVDDAFLLNGKANMYLHEYEKAIVILEHILLEYPKSSAALEAKIQLASILIQSDETERAERLLQEASKTKKISKHLTTLMNATYADLFIQQKKYALATKYLESALKKGSKKATKIRYYFILSELCNHIDKRVQAIDYLNKAIRLNPPYNVVFAAQMRKASLYDPSLQGTSMKQDLLAMLKDEKNEEYVDQIYFALAQVEKVSGNDSQAFDYLTKSVEAESSNDHQKAMAYMMLGDYNYILKSYAVAYGNYINARNILSKDHSQYDSISRKAEGLQKLADNYNIVHTEDSLQHIAAMPVDERNRWVQSMITAIVEKEKREQENQQQNQYFKHQQDMNNRGIGNNVDKSGAWYFYNISAVNAGVSSFNMRWGKRKLEDDWRRKNKRIVAVFSSFDDKENTKESEKMFSNKSSEYYLKNIPLTPEAMAASNERISNALFRLGEAYKDDVQEPLSAISALRALDVRFPQNEYRASSYFYLYELYSATGKLDSATYYKQMLIDNYPKTPLAQQLTNPNYFVEQQAVKMQMETQYETVFYSFNAGRYSEASALAQQIIEQFPNSLLQPQLEFIRALCVGTGGDIVSYKAALSAIIQQYPITDVAIKSSEIIVELEKKELSYAALPSSTNASTAAISGATPDIPSTTAFTVSNKEHYVGFICEKNTQSNELMFALESFNADMFLEKNLETVVHDIGINYVIVFVRYFDTLPEAYEYGIKLRTDDAFNNFSPMEYRYVIISPDNLELLTQSKDVAAYMHFFTVNYIK